MTLHLRQGLSAVERQLTTAVGPFSKGWRVADNVNHPSTAEDGQTDGANLSAPPSAQPTTPPAAPAPAAVVDLAAVRGTERSIRPHP